MNPLLQRVLMGYRPLYLNGLLLDGQYKLPRPNLPDAIGTSRVRQRTVRATLPPTVFHYRSKR